MPSVPGAPVLGAPGPSRMWASSRGGDPALPPRCDPDAASIFTCPTRAAAWLCRGAGAHRRFCRQARKEQGVPLRNVIRANVSRKEVSFASPSACYGALPWRLGALARGVFRRFSLPHPSARAQALLEARRKRAGFIASGCWHLQARKPRSRVVNLVRVGMRPSRSGSGAPNQRARVAAY